MYHHKCCSGTKWIKSDHIKALFRIFRYCREPHLLVTNRPPISKLSLVDEKLAAFKIMTITLCNLLFRVNCLSGWYHPKFTVDVPQASTQNQKCQMCFISTFIIICTSRISKPFWHFLLQLWRKVINIYAFLFLETKLRLHQYDYQEPTWPQPLPPYLVEDLFPGARYFLKRCQE